MHNDNKEHLKNAVISHIKKDNVEFAKTIKEMLNQKVFKLVEDKKIAGNS
jgi:hypothetical protein